MFVPREIVRAAGAALLGIWVLTVAEPERAPGATTPADDARLLLPGLIVEEADLPVDAAGRAVVDAIPGVRARRALETGVEQRLEALTAERARIGARSAGGAAREELPVLPGDAEAPARLDAGDPDPERLHSAPDVP